MAAFFTSVFYQPLYNGLIFLMDVLPWIDAGVAVILFTVIVKLILFPLSLRGVLAQLKMKQVEPELAELRVKYKDDRNQLAKETLDVYKKNDIHPFSGILVLLIQFPIIISLYRIFYTEGVLVTNHNLLYSFVNAPEHTKALFLGLIDVSHKSLVLAILAAVSQFFQAWFLLPPPKPKTDGQKSSFSEDLARSMSMQMRYFFPILVFFIAYNISAGISLYWITSNLFMIGQEIYIRRKYKSKLVTKTA